MNEKKLRRNILRAALKKVEIFIPTKEALIKNPDALMAFLSCLPKTTAMILCNQIDSSKTPIHIAENPSFYPDYDDSEKFADALYRLATGEKRSNRSTVELRKK